MLHAHAYEPVVLHDSFHEKVPADLQRVILRCLEKEPERRYPDVVTLDKDLAACECAGRWTPERADDWWRENGDIAPPAPSPDTFERDSQTAATAAWRAG